MASLVTAAVVVEAGGPFELRRLTIGEPQIGEVKVRMASCGICASDLSARDNLVPIPFPIVLGHEGAGTVEAIGPGVSKVAVGDRVLLSRLSCGRCPSCMEGDRNFCRDTLPLNLGGARPDGSTGLDDGDQPVHGQFFGQSSFATCALAHEQNVTKLPEDLDLALAPAFACGVLTGAGTIISGIRPRAGTTVVVFGAGTVGLSAALAAKVVGCTRIVVVDVSDHRLALAAEIVATHVLNAGTSPDIVSAVRDVLPQGAGVVIEATGKADVATQAIACVAPKGVAAMLGVGTFGQQAWFDQTGIAFSGVSIQGFPTGTSEPDVLVPILVELYKQGRFPVDRLVRHYRFEEIEEAAKDLRNGVAIKPVLLM